MTTTATTLRATNVDSERRLGPLDLMKAEWIKIRSVRSTVWSLIIMFVIAVSLAAIATAVYMSQWDAMTPQDRAQLRADPVGLILQPGSYYGQIAVCVLGVMAMASEYSTGTIRTSILAVPSRIPVLLAKAGVLTALVFVVGEIAAFVGYLVGSGVLSAHVDLNLSQPGVLRAVLGLGLYLPTVCLFAVAIGAMIRHVSGGITTVIGIVLVLPSLASLLPGENSRYVSTYAPGGTAGQLILSTARPPDQLLGPWQGYAVAVGWAVVFLALAAVQLRRRDA